jgi:hypothetical protein
VSKAESKIVAAQVSRELAERLERAAAEQERRRPTRVHVPDHERKVA